MRYFARLFAFAAVLSLPAAALAFVSDAPALSTAREVSLGAAPDLGMGPALSAAQLPELGPVLTAAPVLAAADASVMAPDPETDFAGYAALLLESVVSGDYVVAAALALMGVVWALRRFGGRIHPLLASGKAAVAFTLVAGVGGAVLNALLAGSPLTLALVLKGLMVALTSMGLFSGAKAISKAEEEGAEARALAEQAGRDSVAAWAGGQK